MSERKQFFRDPTGLVNLPPCSIRVEDPEEEVFLLYTALSARKPHDVSTSSSFPGLGSIDSRRDKLTVSFTISPPRSKPSDLENSETCSTGHVSRSKKNARRSKRVEEARTLEIELMQDKTALRSKKGDTGSVLWRVSVALGQAILNDLSSSESPNSLFDPEKLRNCRVLELGAGTGLLSLIFAPWVRHYTVTDLDYLVPLIRKNVAMSLPVVQRMLKATRRSSSSPTKRQKPFFHIESDKKDELLSGVTVEALDWMELLEVRNSPLSRSRMPFRLSHADPPDLIVISDCVYNPWLLPALLATVEYYAESDRTCVLVAAELRSADVVGEFLQLWMSSAAWEVWRVGSRHGDDDGDDDGWLGNDFAVWVGWRRRVELKKERT